MSHPTSPPVERTDWLIAVGLGFAFVALLLPDLSQPLRLVYDETLHTVVASEFLLGMPFSDVAHPPGARMLQALSMWLGPGPFQPGLGNITESQAFAWRLPSLLLAGLSVSLVFALGRSMFGSRVLATIAAILFASDGVLIVHARLGMTNTPVLAFILLMALCGWLALKWDNPRWLLGAGLALGLAVSTRWTGALAGLALALALFTNKFPFHGPQSERLAVLKKWLPVSLLNLGLLPLLVYAAFQLPYILVGSWFLEGPVPRWGAVFSMAGWLDVMRLNQTVYQFHQYGIGSHPYSSPWYAWPFLLHPQWYIFEYARPSQMVTGMVALGNPALWWAAVPALAGATWLAFWRRLPPFAFLAFMGLGMWLPWALTGRGTMFMVYMFEVIPFATLALVGLLGRLPLVPGQRNVVLAAYAAIAVTWTAAYFPLLKGTPAISADRFVASVNFLEWDPLATDRRFRQDHGLESGKAAQKFKDTLGNLRWKKKLVPTPSPGRK